MGRSLIGVDESSKPFAEAVMPATTSTAHACLPATPVSAPESISKVPPFLRSDSFKYSLGILE